MTDVERLRQQLQTALGACSGAFANEMMSYVQEAITYATKSLLVGLFERHAGQAPEEVAEALLNGSGLSVTATLYEKDGVYYLTLSDGRTWSQRARKAVLLRRAAVAGVQVLS